MRHLTVPLLFLATMAASGCAATGLDATAPDVAAPNATESGHRVIYLQHAKAPDLATTLEPLLSDGGAHGGQPPVIVVAHEDANALMVSGPQQRVGQVLKLIEQLDRESGD